MTFSIADAQRVRDAAETAVRDLHAPGVAIGVVAGDDLVFAEGFGFADIEARRKQDPGLRQRIGSITKTMVGLCAMALVDEGKLDLDERLSAHIPELKFHGDGQAITIRHLLTHTSGIGEAAMPDEIREIDKTLWSDAPDKDVLGLFSRGVTIEVPPGSKWSYANLGFALLGEIVARSEGLPIGEVLRRRIFAPLDMANSDLLDVPNPDLATGYHHVPNADARELAARSGTELPKETPVDGHNIRGTYKYIRGGGAAGAVQSTIYDMARYASLLLRRGAGIVKSETFDAMTSRQWSHDPRMEGWGLSFQLLTRFGLQMFGHGGGVHGGWNSMLLVVPARNTALIVHCNASFDGFEKLVSRVLAALLDAPRPTLSGTASAELLASAPGVYEAIPGALTNFRVMGALGRLQIKAHDGRLTLHSRRGRWKKGVPLFLAADGNNAFFLAGDDDLEPGHVILTCDDTGAVTGLLCERLVRMVKTTTTAPWA
jgi:CubicO group peptidase (beta-lactamase class C family)